MTTYLGKSCSFCLPRVPFVNCRQFMYLVISLLVLRAGYGIWLYQFLIITYLFTFHVRDDLPLAHRGETEFSHIILCVRTLSEGSGETARMRRHDWAFAVPLSPYLTGLRLLATNCEQHLRGSFQNVSKRSRVFSFSSHESQWFVHMSLKCSKNSQNKFSLKIVTESSQVSQTCLESFSI